jgi:hypothetical protein
MKRKLLVCLAAFLATATAQNQSAPKPISHYMRETGLLYLENTKKMVVLGLKNPDAEQMLDADGTSEVNSYGEVLQEMEDHIRINISSASDKQYFRLLQRTKAAAELSVFGDLSNLYIACYVQAHTTSIRGAIVGGNCTEHKYEEVAKEVRDAQLKATQDRLARAKQQLEELKKGPSAPELTPVQKELCAKDATFDFCAGTPERKARDRAKTLDLCAKGLFNHDYCAKVAADDPAKK